MGMTTQYSNAYPGMMHRLDKPNNPRAAAPSSEWGDYHRFRRRVFGEVGYEPNEGQELFHRDTSRVRLVAGGERAGKSYSTAMDAVARIGYVASQGTYWILGPDYAQPRIEFEYIVGAFQKLGVEPDSISMPVSKTNPWVARYEGLCILETKTTNDIKKIASVALDGAIMAEAAQQEYEVFLKARGRIAERRGWLVLSGTFESSLGWYAKAWERWQGANNEQARSFSLPTWGNLAVYPGGREDAEIKALEATYPSDLFMERFGAIPMKPQTVVLREFNHGDHVKEWVKYERGKPASIWVDPGYFPGFYAVAVVQYHEGEDGREQVWIVDEIYEQEKTGQEVIAICKSREWWVDVKDGVMDRAGRQHHAHESQHSVWLQEGGVYLRSNYISVLDGIDRHRTFLKDPGSGRARLLHAPHLKNTFEEYGNYRRPADAEGRAVQEIPIDRNNHLMKAIAYGLYDRYGPVDEGKRRRGKVEGMDVGKLWGEGEGVGVGRVRRRAGRVILDTRKLGY